MDWHLIKVDAFVRNVYVDALVFLHGAEVEVLAEGWLNVVRFDWYLVVGRHSRLYFRGRLRPNFVTIARHKLQQRVSRFLFHISRFDRQCHFLFIPLLVSALLILISPAPLRQDPTIIVLAETVANIQTAVVVSCLLYVAYVDVFHWLEKFGALVAGFHELLEWGSWWGVGLAHEFVLMRGDVLF